MKGRKALFPGSFDPFTLGHLDVLKRALGIFDEVVVAVGVNPDKKAMLTVERRLEIISRATAGMAGVRVDSYTGLTVEYCRSHGIDHMVRGVRNAVDMEREVSIADVNRILAPEIDTVLIPASPKFAGISSSAVRDIHRNGGDISALMPDGIESL